MRLENNKGQLITSLSEWAAHAPPASSRHWRPYRSAYELALAWTDCDAPARLTALLELAPAFSGTSLERAIAERKTYFDAIPGGPRNHDLRVIGSTGAGPLVVGVEGKADEPFDRTLSDYRAAALAGNPASRAPARLDGLTRAFFATTLDQDPTLGGLRYQLLSALAGTLADARSCGATHAALVVQEFATPLTSPAKHRANAADLEAFLTRLGDAGRWTADDGAWLAGPFTVPGNDYLARVPFYVGKLVSIVAPRPEDPVSSSSSARTAPDSPGRGDARRGSAPRARVVIPVGGGRTVIKLNVHPPGCRCGCASRGARPFVLNRPGERVANRQFNDLDDVLELAREWGEQALAAPPGLPVGTSPIQVGGDATTIALTIDPAGASARFVVTLPETGERSVAGHLADALSMLRARALRALAG